ncbi:hypothetical protein B0J11DRAFT_84353 [Dendryphion nanum]|uniref:Uncharacterized protein n=1 Tax=Dendryphion nanum TaxID=256645 RepID=A0A9P9DHM2_9PLEO|nr:hypothetical protein B0J11DRAFT_84353 [Dendryphion nanum]
MGREKTITISQPFDARHVSGVSVGPMQSSIQRSFTSTLEPDEVPTHLNISSHSAPRRSNSIAHSLSRPSLRLKTSLSILRGRTSSNPPDTRRKKERDQTPESQKLAAVPLLPRVPPKPSTSYESQNSTMVSTVPRVPPKTSYVTDSQRPAIVRVPTKTTNPPAPTRPKRADSGTAVDFDDQPVRERPMGFKEIMAVRSYQERMKLYSRTRDYWATTEHGLDEWVEKARVRKPLPLRIQT